MSNTEKYVSKAGQTLVYGVNGDGNPEYMRVNKQFGGLLLVSPMEQSTITGSQFYTFEMFVLFHYRNHGLCFVYVCLIIIHITRSFTSKV